MDIKELIRQVAQEIWVGILPGYEVSNLGRVRIMKQNNIGKYYSVQFWINGKGYNHLVHNLVLTAFVGPRPLGMQACHYDGNGFKGYI